LARVLETLITAAQRGESLPPCLNLALPPALSMADLLTAAGADWRFGPPRAGAVPRVEVSLARLAGLVDLPQATGESIMADLTSLHPVWP
jgi:hypothetical protein